jgi:hypothetical protein
VAQVGRLPHAGPEDTPTPYPGVPPFLRSIPPYLGNHPHHPLSAEPPYPHKVLPPYRPCDLLLPCLTFDHAVPSPLGRGGRTPGPLSKKGMVGTPNVPVKIQPRRRASLLGRRLDAGSGHGWSGQGPSPGEPDAGWSPSYYYFALVSQ